MEKLKVEKCIGRRVAVLPPQKKSRGQPRHLGLDFPPVDCMWADPRNFQRGESEDEDGEW